MRIAIDARWIFKEISGIGSYTESLIKHLAKVDRENEYLLLFDHKNLRMRTAERTQFNTAPNFQASLLPYGPFALRSQLHLPRELEDHHIDVFHSPNYMVPLRMFPKNGSGRTKCVVTIHDLIPLIFPDHAPKSKKSRLFPIYKKIMYEVAQRADVIIAVSQATRGDILRHLRIPESDQDKVVAIPEGVGAEYTMAGDRSPDHKVVLYVGRMDPYKNVLGLVEAFAAVRERIDVPTTLRIIGPDDPRYPEPRQYADSRGISESIEWMGYVTPEQLKHNYQHADVLVLPSRYEGFGLPVLEAMACGTPVICSNQSSLPEVAGDAAILVDPDDTGQIADSIVDILTNSKLAHDMSEAGARHAARYRWTKTAELTIEAYAKAYRET